MTDKRPNVLLFCPDAMQASVVDPDSDCITPNFDRVAARGLRFTRAHTCLPTCSPARASLMTGLLPHNHGVLQVEHCVDDDQSVLRTQHPHFAHRLSDAGYRTGYFGKWHVERTNQLEDFGWQVNGCDAAAALRDLGAGIDESGDLIGRATLVRHEKGPDGYRDIMHYAVTDTPTEQRSFAQTTSNAINFLDDAAKRNEPWACMVSFTEPNTPLITGRAAFEKYDVDNIKLPANLDDTFENSPGLYRREKQVHADTTDRHWRELRAAYFALITELDMQLGRLLDQLEKTGDLDNTVIIIMSDHGRYVGAHGYDAHNFAAFEEIYRIPFVAAGPGIPTGKTSDALVSIHDLAPTLIDLAGGKPLDDIDGRAFTAALHDADAAGFDTAYAEYHGTRFTLTQRIVWDGDWKFVFNGFDFDELYNLKDDPHELRNLGNDPQHADRIRAMTATMWQYARDSGDRAILETHYSPMRIAAVGPDA